MTEERPTRKLTAILSADVKGYSRLMGVDEKATVDTLKQSREVFRHFVRECHGRVVDSPGDNIMAEFGSVVDAVESAVKIQKDLQKKNAGLPETRRMEFRIGVNLGDVIDDEGLIYGDGVNVAARIEGLSEGGGICISGTAFDQVKNKLDAGYQYLGEHSVKNIAEPVRVYKVLMEPEYAGKVIGEKRTRIVKWRWTAMGGVAILIIMAGIFMAWQLYLRPPFKPASLEKTAFPLPDKPSIAVLPFTNLSDNPEQAYFADGMTEDLITDLSKVAGLFVIARNSTFVYKGKATDIREVARTLGVRYVLEGSVRRSGAEVRVNAQLIDATTGGHVWADRFDGDLKNIFAFQDKVTRNVVTALAVELTKDDRDRVARRGTGNVQAYDLFLKGWQNYLRQTPEDFRAAIVLFKKAVELDPEYGRAYAALAATYWEASSRFWDLALGYSRTHEALFQAEQFLAKAMRNPTPLSHQVASAMLLHTKQHDEAIAEAKRAITSDPNDADGYIALANALSFTGRAGDALEQVERAIRLNPHYPPHYQYQLGLARFGMKRLDEAATSLEQALRFNRDDYWSQRLLLATYGLLGRRTDAAKLLETIKGNEKSGWLAVLDPLTIRASTYWYPFAERADAERFAEGLRKAGVPE